MIRLIKAWDATQILQAAYSVEDYYRKIVDADHHIDVAVDRLQSMCGQTAQAASGFCSRLAATHEEYQRDLATFRDALFPLGYDLSACQTRLDEIPELARAAQLAYIPGEELILKPSIQFDDHESIARYSEYLRLESMAEAIQRDAQAAFDTFKSRCQGLFARAERADFFGLLSDAVRPKDARGWAEWSLNRADEVGAGITWGAIAAGKGTVHIPIGLGPDGTAGILLRPAETTGQRILNGMNPRNWVPQKPVPAWLSRGSTFVAKHSGKLKAAGGVLSVASGLFEAHKQWQADELRPDLTQGQRQVRAVATGTLTAGGGWAGTLGGAKLGVLAGAALGGPVGAAVGGIVGGIIGGVAGSWLGGKIAGGFKRLVGG